MMHVKQVYKVGGAVRDELLGLPAKDEDFVAIGFTVQEFLDMGYEQVGKDFPVFLHPVTHHEYALARRERSTGNSYLDFTVDTSNVSLEEDLSRRDLTINAIAKDSDGNYIDPYNGIKDLNGKILRHVSDAFKEDPVRVLRIARFKARYGYEWRIHPTTKLLVDTMHEQLKALQPDRVFKEAYNAMREPNPELFFKALDEMQVLHIVFPEIADLKSYREGSVWHNEPNVFEHTMMMLRKTDDPTVRWMALYHDICKPVCRRLYGNGAGHDSAELAEPLVNLKMPSKLKERILFAIDNHIPIAQAAEYELSPRKIAKLFKSLRKDRELLLQLVELCKIDKLSSNRIKQLPELDFDWLIEAFDKCCEFSPKDWIQPEHSPEVIKQYIHQNYIRITKEEYRNSKKDFNDHTT